MFSSINLYLSIFCVIIVLGFSVVCKKYITLSNNYKIATQTINQMEKQNKLEDKILLQLKKQVSGHHDVKTRALLDIERDGFVHTDDGINPNWMCNNPKGCGKK